MHRIVVGLSAAALAIALAGPVLAESEGKEPAKAPAVLRCARSYAEAMAEAKDRGCIVFATLHRDG